MMDQIGLDATDEMKAPGYQSHLSQQISPAPFQGQVIVEEPAPLDYRHRPILVGCSDMHVITGRLCRHSHGQAVGGKKQRFIHQKQQPWAAHVACPSNQD